MPAPALCGKGTDAEELVMVLSKTFSRLLSRFRKQILIAFDILVISLAYIAPWVLINGRADYQRYASLLVASWFLFVCCFEIVYGLMGMYDSLWRYAEIVEFFRLCVASIIAVALFVVSSLFIFSETRVPGIVLGLLFYCVFFFDRALSVIPEAWDPTSDALTCRLFYGLLLYMGASLFISDGLFPGIRLIFMDRDLYIDDYRKRVALLAFDFILAPSTKNQPLYHRTSPPPPHSILSQIVY